MGDTSLTTRQAADILGVIPRRVRVLIQTGQLAADLRGRDLMVSYASLQRLLKERAERKRKAKA